VKIVAIFDEKDAMLHQLNQSGYAVFPTYRKCAML
jgi:hypothetical protein